jgi:hypothetical protein
VGFGLPSNIARKTYVTIRIFPPASRSRGGLALPSLAHCATRTSQTVEFKLSFSEQ